ncbi:O-antigen ligase family protein [Hymenobacter cavernae]|uniref:O-antigen ligase family protein n=1 Tax=Hymenobacter cavernae TaxID=2044852 RepID=UPI001666C9A6|nr:O-antigen ligase family protein [Hymenobacter cavernae]
MPNLSIPHIQRAAAVFCGLTIIGLFTHDFLPYISNVGIAGLALTALFYFITQERAPVAKPYRVIYISLTGVFLVHLASGLNTEVVHQEAFLEDVVMQLPFLLLPLSFTLLPAWPATYLRRLYLLFFNLVLVSALSSTGYYLLHAAEINESYSRSKIMPTVPDYIRFSLMVVFATSIGIFFTKDKLVSRYKRWTILIGTAFLVLYTYLLAVRSGLLSFNAIGLLVVGWLIIKQKSYKQAIIVTLLLIALPVVSFVCFPTFRHKYYNTQYDVSQVQTASSANNLSLVGRFYSYEVGLQLVRQNPWFGVGKADMEQEVGRFYKRDFPSIESTSYLMPHNQFLYYWVAFGGVGLLAFLCSFYYPLYRVWNRVPPLLLVQYSIVTLSFIAEFTLDQKNQVGLTYSLLFILVSLAEASSISPKSSSSDTSG